MVVSLHNSAVITGRAVYTKRMHLSASEGWFLPGLWVLDVVSFNVGFIFLNHKREPTPKLDL